MQPLHMVMTVGASMLTETEGTEDAGEVGALGVLSVCLPGLKTLERKAEAPRGSR